MEEGASRKGQRKARGAVWDFSLSSKVLESLGKVNKSS